MERSRGKILPRIGKAVAGWIRSVSPLGEPPAHEAIQKVKFPEVEQELVKQTELLLAASLLLGMDHAEEGVELAEPPLEYHPLPFQEAIQFLRARVSMTKAERAELEPKLAFRAFTLAKLTQCDYIEAVRGRLVYALEKGEGLEQTWEDVRALAEEDGSTIKPGYWETVYRTNVQTAYNAGRRMQFDRAKPKAYALMVLEDERTSAICRPLVGLVLPSDHPFWENHWPPFHFNCRTTVRGIYEEEGEIPVQNVSMKQLRKEFRPQKGFGENPLAVDSFWMFTPSMLERAQRYGIENDFYNLYLRIFRPSGKEEHEITFSSVPYKPLREKLVQAFQNAPETIRRQVAWNQNRVAVVPSVKYKDEWIGYFYQEREHAVFLSAEVDARSIRHEYGHAVDFGLLGVSKWKDFGRAMDQDRVQYISKSGALTRRGENILRDPSWKAEPALSDTFSALTKNRICGRYIHKTEYWELGVEYQNAEVVANAYDVWASGQKELLKQYRSLFPALAVFFDKLFSATYTIQ